ncbi:hypothetical protein, partial [Promicromonospora sp. NPDC050249]|uniref:hypothetical protein n=1 Tax=Promicromonospora sp. NPDC050249 TaxID=3154743 RepID=UPI003408EB4C
YAEALLRRARTQSELNSFITIDEVAVLLAATHPADVTSPRATGARSGRRLDRRRRPPAMRTSSSNLVGPR